MSSKSNWRIQGIDAGTTKEQVLDYFEGHERKRITIFPSVDEPYKSLTATLEYEYEPESSIRFLIHEMAQTRRSAADSWVSHHALRLEAHMR
jgi:hypothetical protein